MERGFYIPKQSSLIAYPLLNNNSIETKELPNTLTRQAAPSE